MSNSERIDPDPCFPICHLQTPSTPVAFPLLRDLSNLKNTDTHGSSSQCPTMSPRSKTGSLFLPSKPIVFSLLTCPQAQETATQPWQQVSGRREASRQPVPGPSSLSSLLKSALVVGVNSD